MARYRIIVQVLTIAGLLIAFSGCRHSRNSDDRRTRGTDHLDEALRRLGLTATAAARPAP